VPGTICRSGLSPKKRGQGSARPAAAHSRSGACPPPIRLFADLGLSAAGRVGGQLEAGQALISLRGAPVAHAGAPTKAYRPASRASSRAGRPYRILTVVDTWSRSSPVLEDGFRISGALVSPVLDRVLSQGRSPRSITVDYGTEFQSRALEDWAYHRGGQLDFIRPGKPVENAIMESFNGRLRDECLKIHQFASLAEAQAIIEAWCVDDNTRRPHSSLGHLAPSEFVRQRQEEQDTETVICSP